MRIRTLFLFLLSFPLICCKSTMIISDKAQNSEDFTKDQLSLIHNGDVNTPMRLYKINNKQDSLLLRTKCEEVILNDENPELEMFVKRLHRTVIDSVSMGVGIAASQVGILKNIIWVQRFDKEAFPFEVYINPKITKYSKLTQDCLEGCLSIPDRRDTTNNRSYAILLEYDKLDNTHHIEMIEDFTAVIFQHEIDHLNGILYIDHLEQEIKDANKKL